MMNINMDKIVEIITKTFVPEQIGTYEETGDFSNEDWAEDLCIKMNAERWDLGATKLVFIFDNYVIKFPLEGEWHFEYDKEGYCEDEFFVPFKGAFDRNDGWDYCKAELIHLEDALSEGYEDFFIEEKFLCHSKNGHPVYVQKIAKTFYEGINSVSVSDKSEKTAKNITISIHEKWIAAAIECYGLYKVKNFISFLEEYNLDEDLHNGNIGFSADFKPVIIDWGGFNH